MRVIGFIHLVLVSARMESTRKRHGSHDGRSLGPPHSPHGLVNPNRRVHPRVLGNLGQPRAAVSSSQSPTKAPVVALA